MVKKNRAELRKEIGKIFVKWGLPTVQVVINEILNLFEEQEEEQES